MHQATCGWDLSFFFFNPCNGSTPEEDLFCNSKRQGGGFGGAQIALMYPGQRRFLVVELPTPGGLRRALRHPSSSRPAIVSTQPPLPAFLRLKPGKFGNRTGAVLPSPLCPNFRRLDQSMQITAATAIAFAFETEKRLLGNRSLVRLFIL